MNKKRDGASVSNDEPLQEFARRPYQFPQLLVMKLESVVKGTGSKKPDGLGQPAGLS